MAPEVNVETVREMADITQTYTTAIAIVGVFMVIILVAFAISMWENRADRRLEREEREADRQARAKLDQKRIEREDDNTVYWRDAISKMTAAVSASNALGARIEQTLQRTHDEHDNLSVQVTKTMDEIAALRLEIAQRDAASNAEDKRMILMLERMEKALASILEREVQGDDSDIA